MRKPMIFCGVLFCSTAVLSGCGVGSLDHSTGGTLALHGTVHGGQQPVSGSTIQLYTVGSTGNGSAATPMLTRSVVSDADGSFDITGDYACGKSGTGTTIGSPSNQVYIVANGGNPGLSSGTNNAAIVLLTALGSCANLTSASSVEINEVTTAAAAWALAPFAVSSTSIGASATNSLGIENAFLDAQLLADSATGQAPTLASNLTVETGKLYAMANAIASCVNSNGGAACTPLFSAATPTGVPTPTHTFVAALNIVKHPGQNVLAVYQAAGSKPPFPTGLTQAPNDWTMSMTVTGGGLLDPTALAIDAESNVWVAGQNSPLSAFNAQGKPLSDTGFGIGVLYKTDGITIDANGDIWVPEYNTTYTGSGAVSKFRGVNSTGSGTLGSVVMNGNSTGFSQDIYFPFTVAADTNGNIFVANNGNGTATVLTSAGAIYTDPASQSSAYLGGTLNLGAFPNGIAVDTNHGFWLPDGDQTVSHITANGDLISQTSCCDGSWGVATDKNGDLWVANYYGNSFSELGSDGTLLVNQAKVGGIETPEYLAVDAGQNVWFGNNRAASITEIAAAGSVSGLSAGSAVSPTVGVYTQGGYGLDAGLWEPNYIAPDRSGNLWTASEHNNHVVMFFGLATPTVTPLQPVPTAP